MGGAGSGPESSADVTCPRPGHESSRVRKDGLYGKPGHRRQRYKCVPSNGDKTHCFTEKLPREEAWHAACEQCERPTALMEGPRAAKKHQFVAKGISEALISVGAGESYRRASEVSRTAAHRHRHDPETGEVITSAHGQLVADWVEVFAPIVFEPFRPEAWPDGSLVVDHLPFRVSAFDDRGRPVPAGVVAFDVFAAMGYVAGEPRIWRLEAFADANTLNWKMFLRSLPGEPSRVVCDSHTGTIRAIKETWPNADIYLSEWHLKHALKRLLHNQAKKGPNVGQLTQLKAEVSKALRGPDEWDLFAEKCRAVKNASLTRWINKMEPTILAQMKWREDPANRGRGLPLSTGGLEERLRPIKDAIYPRRYVLKNRERLNRLLQLMQLHSNKQASVATYSRIIREQLEDNDGRPIVPRRQVTDPKGYSSLR